MLKFCRICRICWILTIYIIQNFCQVRDFFCDNAESAKILMRIYYDHLHDACCYNTPTVSDVATIIVDDGHEIDLFNQDIVLNLRDGTLQRILELHPSYDSLQ